MPGLWLHRRDADPKRAGGGMSLEFRIHEAGVPGRRPIIARSRCGRYQITELLGSSSPYSWMAWRLTGDRGRIGFFCSRDEAKAACADDAAEADARRAA